MNRDLMLAILALDAYNRGPKLSKPGLEGVDTTLGTVGVGFDQPFDAASGFSAHTYVYDGDVVISYRGTDTSADARSYGVARVARIKTNPCRAS